MGDCYEVHTFAELDRKGQWTDLSLELLGDAKSLADRIGGKCNSLVLSPFELTLTQREQLADYGSDSITNWVNTEFGNWCSSLFASVLAQKLPKKKALIFLPGTIPGEELAGILGEALQGVWLSDVLKSSVTRNGTIEVTTVETGGKLSRNQKIRGEAPVVLTMKRGVAEAKKRSRPEIRFQCESITLDSSFRKSLVTKHLPVDPAKLDISIAEKIVAGGLGSGGPQGIQKVKQLAHRLKACFAVSRPIVDNGWEKPTRQVGQTGKTVKPQLYVACGISGASHHRAGMRESKNIIAINPDKKAPIHELAHLSLPVDLHELIPLIETKLLERENSRDT